jgi:drug/metabolite transporter (DMT)-like permease
MKRILLVLFLALIFESAGVVLLGKGLKLLTPPTAYTAEEMLHLVGRAFLNKYIVFGVFFEALFFLGLLNMMSKADVSFVWPLTSLTFVFSTLLARFYLHEEISVLRWIGVVCIMWGAAVITYSEKGHRPKTDQPTSSGPRV